MRFYLTALLGFLPLLVGAQAPTDTIRDADQGCSGYLPNHNMDPSVVNSTAFGVLWTKAYDPKEKWYGRPLVYTSPNINGGKQILFLASSKNGIRTLDAKTGTDLVNRVVMPPFLQSDIGCTDIPNFIGIIGTPVIDPASDTVYFFAKGYKGNAAGGGVANGIYQFYAVNLVDLTDRPGFPVLVDGNYADNDHTRYFIGGTVLQRPALTLVNSVVYGGFGGHCDLFNYTGMIVGVSTKPNVGVVTIYAMETSPYVDPPSPDITIQKGGKGGVWMGGFGIASDGGRLFFSTGNGQGHQNQGNPASGRILLSTLDECVVNLAIAPDGKLTLSDYFEPYEYTSLDAADRDLGSAGVTLLDPTVFKGPGVSKMAVSVGKNGKAYILNADNLGGYKMGPGGGDAIVQTITAANAIFAGAGSYPGEGGYIYYTPVGFPTVALKLGTDINGNPTFSQVGQTYRSYGANPGLVNSAGRVGPGIPTITTNKGQPGSALLWRTDPDGGLQVFSAVPDSNGFLQQISIPPTGGLNKFLRPVFGDSRLYVTDNNGNVVCLGSPVAVPLQCTAPVDFGDVTLGTSKTLPVSCTAQIAITSLAGLKTSDPSYVASNSSLPGGPLTAGQTFTFPVTWNLNNTASQNQANASFGIVTPGIKTGVLTVFTNNAVANYVNSYPVSLTGNQVSSTPFLKLSPGEMDFAGLVLGSASSANGVPSQMIIANAGSTPMTILGYGYSTDAAGPYTNTSSAGVNGTQVGPGFTSKDLPPVNTVLQPGQSITVTVLFYTDTVGLYSNIFTIWSDGGKQYTLMSASATTKPIGTLGIETSEGGWSTTPVMNFGNVQAGSVATRRIRICNSGGSPLTVTKSKPPITPELRAENPTGDLHEGQIIAVNSCAYGPVDVAANPEQANVADHTVSADWILNTDDPSFGGPYDVAISANIRSIQAGPTYPNGTAVYQYLGCYYDGSGRQLAKQFNNANNSNSYCTAFCQQNGFTFAGTEYHTECWCGNSPPAAAKWSDPALKQCSFTCPGDSAQICGGNPTVVGIFYDSTKYTPGCDSVPCSSTSTTAATVSSTTTLSTGTTTGFSNNTATLSGTTTATDLSNSVITSSVSTAATTTVTSSATPTPTGPIVNPGNSNWTSLGCWHDPNQNGITKTVFPNTKIANDNMTVSYCLNACQAKGNLYAGVEYGRECYCGNTIAVNATSNYNGCNMLCALNKFEYCGGPNAMNVYQFGVTSTSSSSTTTVASSTTGTLASSATASVVSGTSSSPGTVAPNSTISATGSPTPTDTALVSSTTSVNGTALSTDTATTTVIPTTSVNGTALSTDTATATVVPTTSVNGTALSTDTATATVVPTTSVNGTALSTDTATATVIPTTSVNGTALSTDTATVIPTTLSTVAPSSTTDTAVSITASSATSATTPSTGTASPSGSGSASGTTSASGSVSGSTTASASDTASGTPSGSTTAATTGPASTTATTTPATTSPSTTSTLSAPTPTVTDGYIMKGCYAEPANTRALPTKLLANDTMSVEKCISLAHAKLPATTYGWIALEYSRECWAATAMPPTPTQLVGSKACAFKCKGNLTENCGGQAMFNLYVTTDSASLTTTGSVSTVTLGTIVTTPAR